MMKPEAIMGNSDNKVKVTCCATILAMYTADTPNHNSPIITNLIITDALIS